MSTIALALAIGGRQVLPQTPILAEWPAARLETVLTRMGGLTKTTLRAGSNVRDLVIVLHLKKRPADEVLKLIAEATRATWTQDRDGWTLQRTTESDQQVIRADRQAQTDSVASQLRALRTKNYKEPWNLARVDDLVKAIDKIKRPPADGRGMSLDGPRYASPLRWLLDRLYAGVPADDLVGLGPRGVLERTTGVPNGPAAFGESDRKVIVGFLSKQDEFFDVLRARLDGASTKDPLYKDLFDLGDPSRRPLEFRLQVRDWLTRLAPYLTVNDAKGRQVSWAMSPYEQWVSRYPHVEFAERLTKTAPEVRLRDESERYVRYQPKLLGTSPRFAVPFFDKHGFREEDRPLFVETAKYDPQSFHVTDALVGLAKTLGDELVAIVPDEFFTTVHGATVDDSIRWAAIWKELSVRSTVEMEERRRILFVRPSLPDLSRRLQLNRTALATLMRVVGEKGYIPFVDWAVYCAKSRTFSTVQSLRYASLSPFEASGAATPHGITMHEDATAEFVGALPATELARLARGEAVSVSRIPKSQTDRLLDVAQNFKDSRGDYPHSGRPLPEIRQITVTPRKTLLRLRSDRLQDMTSWMIDDVARPGTRTSFMNDKSVPIVLRDSIAFEFRVTWADGTTTGTDVYELGRLRTEKGPDAVKLVEQFQKSGKGL